jgi:hypothetical protein
MQLCAEELPPLRARAELAMGSDVASDCSLDPAFTVCVRGTFLDCVSPASITSRRSSDPGPQVERPSFFAEQEGYAKQLQEKMSIVMEEFAGLSSTVLTPMSARSRGSTGFSGSWEPAEPEGGAGLPDAPLAHGFPSNGSIGHPVLCRQPCKEPASCRPSCSFCHQCSVGKPRRRYMDKKNRQAFRFMGHHEKIEALLGVMRVKVAELGLGAEAAQALDEWHADLTTAPPVQEQEPSTVSQYEVERLRRHFETLYLNDLCFVSAPKDDELRAASLRLLEKLRDLRAAA